MVRDKGKRREKQSEREREREREHLGLRRLTRRAKLKKSTR